MAGVVELQASVPDGSIREEAKVLRLTEHLASKQGFVQMNDNSLSMYGFVRGRGPRSSKL